MKEGPWQARDGGKCKPTGSWGIKNERRVTGFWIVRETIKEHVLLRRLRMEELQCPSCASC